MKIAGLQKVSLIDYPQKIACTIFTQGCNFRCPYCHNPELLSTNSDKPYIDEAIFFDFLTQRKGKIDGVCITGGEPTLQKDLIDFISKIVDLGFIVKLDSNGTDPTMLKQLINLELLDYIAMDIKSPKAKYDKISQTHNLLPVISNSIKIIMESDVDYEFRTTAPKEILSIDDLKQISKELVGVKRWIIQNFQPFKTKGYKSPQFSTYSTQDLEEVVQFAKEFVKEVQIR